MEKGKCDSDRAYSYVDLTEKTVSLNIWHRKKRFSHEEKHAQIQDAICSNHSLVKLHILSLKIQVSICSNQMLGKLQIFTFLIKPTVF